MTERDFYTPAGFDAMKKKLSIACIEKWITRRAFDAVGASAYLSRTAENGYEFALDHGVGLEPEMMTPEERAKHVVHVWPPIGPEHAGPRRTMRDLNGDWLPEQTDVWATYYQPWFERVNTAFEGWDQLPDERDFHDSARNLEVAADSIELDPRALPDHSGNASLVSMLDALDSIFGIRSGGGMAGETVSAFRANYQGKLAALISQQYWIARMLSTKLQATGDMWREARKNVMEIGHAATEALGETFGRYDPAADPRQVRAVLTALGQFADYVSKMRWIPNVVAGGAEAVAIGIEVYDTLDPAPVFTPVEEIFNGSTPENVMDNLYTALGRLDRQIVDEENAVGTWARGITDKTYEPSTPKAVYFNLGPPQLISETSAQEIGGELRVNTALMRYGGALLNSGATGDAVADFEDSYTGGKVAEGLGLADLLDLAAANLPGAAPSATAWQRPAHIGVNGNGSYDAWTALHQRLVDLLQDTSGELKAAGEHLEIAADVIDGVDGAAEATLERHAAEVADVAAPDPGPRRPEPTPSGGPQP